MFHKKKKSKKIVSRKRTAVKRKVRVKKPIKRVKRAFAKGGSASGGKKAAFLKLIKKRKEAEIVSLPLNEGKVTELIDKGKFRGFLTEEEILYVFTEAEEYLEKLEEFLAKPRTNQYPLSPKRRPKKRKKRRPKPLI